MLHYTYAGPAVRVFVELRHDKFSRAMSSRKTRDGGIGRAQKGRVAVRQILLSEAPTCASLQLACNKIPKSTEANSTEVSWRSRFKNSTLINIEDACGEVRLQLSKRQAEYLPSAGSHDELLATKATTFAKVMHVVHRS